MTLVMIYKILQVLYFNTSNNILPKLTTQERGRMKPGPPFLTDEELCQSPPSLVVNNNREFSIDWSGFTHAGNKGILHPFLALSCVVEFQQEYNYVND